MASRLLYPKNYASWKRSLHYVGYENVVGTVMPDGVLETCAKKGQLYTEQMIEKAALAVAHVALGVAFKELRSEKTAENWGLHVDISGEEDYGSGVPELSFWVNRQGASRWTLHDTGSRDKDTISEAMSVVQMEVSHDLASNGLMFNPEFSDRYAQVEFHGLGMLAFAAGLQNDGDRHPAMHQVETIASESAVGDRLSCAIYGRRTS